MTQSAHKRGAVLRLIISHPEETEILEVVYVDLPGVTGRFGVFRNQPPQVVQLKGGLVEAYNQNPPAIPVLRRMISGGFAKINGEEVRLLLSESDVS